MSGIYIPGMEMPTDGSMIFAIRPDGMVEDVMGCYVGKAIPVPPHGRLGDLDKLENGLRHMAKYQFGERQQGIFGCCEIIRLAPTIIPAEEAE